MARPERTAAVGYKNATGKIVIPPKFRNAYPFSEGLAEVKDVSLTGFIDKTGKYAIKPCRATDSLPRNGQALLANLPARRSSGALKRRSIRLHQ